VSSADSKTLRLAQSRQASETLVSEMKNTGPVDASGEDEAGRGRQPHRRLPEVPPGEGSVQVQANA
jgi:hypothetical protein